jgi:omega-hydroxy-beta-dihydromenaquinone-9 sulfotransferase
MDALLAAMPASPSRLDCYKAFMAGEVTRAGKRYACEKTPQNIFYIRELLQHFPSTKVIVMYRDPRAVMLSQKRKWKRKFLGNDSMPYREILRLRMNYHPYTIGKLWNASFRAAEAFAGHEQVVAVRFEDLTAKPEETMAEVCRRIGIPMDPAMLEVPHSGSSSGKDDPSKKGIRKDRTETWKKELGATEIHICEKVCGPFMRQLGYAPLSLRPSVLSLAWAWLAFPAKLLGAFFLNLGRMRNIADTLKRRLARS